MKFVLICEDCGTKSIYEAKTKRRIMDNARDDGWAINRDNERQWCPKCAPMHRNTGRRGNHDPNDELMQTSVFGTSGEKPFKAG